MLAKQVEKVASRKTDTKPNTGFKFAESELAHDFTIIQPRLFVRTDMICVLNSLLIANSNCWLPS